MATMLYRAGKEMLVNNDLWCDTITVEDDAVDAALAEGWCLHYRDTADAEEPKRGPGRPRKAD